MCALRLLGAGKDLELIFFFPSFLFLSFLLDMNISMHFLVVLATPFGTPSLGIVG